MGLIVTAFQTFIKNAQKKKGEIPRSGGEEDDKKKKEEGKKSAS